MKKLPIGIQTLSKIIEDGFVYVDKTEIALRIVERGQYYFLSRPRRFGKSLFLSTLKEIFEGNEALFKGLYIDGKWDFSKTKPVIHLSFGSGISRSIEALHRNMKWMFMKAEKSLGISLKDDLLPKEKLTLLITEAYERTGKKVVILIDEYDKPILDNITNEATARIMRDEMREFYSVIKDYDGFIELVFITGVSKFSKMSLFSGLNNLNDITLDERYATICGYTDKDLDNVFGKHLEGVDRDKVREWYNGYNYLGDKVYNPFDILLFIDKGHEFRNYWWSTGNPQFLIELITSKSYSVPNVENYEATEAILNSFDVDRVDIEALLWQTGYLTIKEKYTDRNRLKYRLVIPNLEIQLSLNDCFIDALTTQKSEKLNFQDRLYDVLTEGDLDALQQVLKSLFSSIPYHNFTNNKIADYEGYYASVIYAYFASLGFEIIAEDTTSQARIDMTLKVEDKIYIFEFKVINNSATGNALEQIKAKKYHKKYLSEEKDIFLVGIEFNREERNIERFEWAGI